MPDILFISNNNLTDRGLSGGDRILIELIKNWKKSIPVGFSGSQEAANLLKRYRASSKVIFYLSAKIKKSTNLFSNYNYFYHGLNRTFWGIFSLFKYRHQLSSYSHIYSASDFYPDTLPACLLKLLYPQKIWLASFYLFAPAPWSKNNPYVTDIWRFFTGLFYWLSQKVSYFLIYYFADYVFVTSQPDVAKFTNSHRKASQIIVVQGGVDTSISQKYLQNHHLPASHPKYLATYVGRLHPQKGVVKLIDIWKLVIKQYPHAKLAIIGDGQLKPQLQSLINQNHLQHHIKLLGFLDGPKKYQIFKNSLMVVHPATYDSGGMAAAEAMAWGLPGISFDLESLKTYYPQGMIKTSCFDIKEFSDNIIKIASQKKLYHQLSQQAISLINQHWSWEKRSQTIFNQVFKNFRQ